MKTSLMFRDQVNVLNNWFDAWNECEQIVAMYSLFRKLTPGPTKFLMQVLNQNSEGCVDIQYKESRANNPGNIDVSISHSRRKKILALSLNANLKTGYEGGNLSTNYLFDLVNT